MPDCRTGLDIHPYAQRMIIENSIEDGIDFFHMDALSSAVAMKVNCDLQLTLMASSLSAFWVLKNECLQESPSGTDRRTLFCLLGNRYGRSAVYVDRSIQCEI